VSTRAAIQTRQMNTAKLKMDRLLMEECDGKIGFRILKSAESHLAIRERILLLSPDGLRRKSPGVRPKTGKPSAFVAVWAWL